MASVIPFDRAAHNSIPSVPVPRNAEQLDNIKAHLDLILLALEALTNIGSEAILQAAQELHLSGISDRVNLWRLRQASPLRKGQGGRKKLDVEEARTLVLVSCHLAHQHQRTVRHAVGVLEQFSQQNRPPHEAPILGDYIDRFCNLYEDRMQAQAQTPRDLTALALKLLIDLLFYSGDSGPKRLWLALIERSVGQPSASSSSSNQKI
ncbi:MAG: DUF3038 domain-containing protein [Prochlorotrichaceae cyanobacterium]